MKNIIQLSDLHFGKTDAKVVQCLKDTIHSLKPDVIAISGDLTQRAKKREFAAAKEFLQSLPFPQVIVPGNHDIPLYNVWKRFVKPLAGYNEVATPAHQKYIDEEIAILGINTARSLVFKGGHINEAQVGEVVTSVASTPASNIKMVVTHHPILEVASEELLEQLISSGVNIFLAGHHHSSSNSKVAYRFKEKEYSAVLIQAGTATSVRYRGESNSFNVIQADSEQQSIFIIRYIYDAANNAFNPTDQKRYQFIDGAWKLTLDQ